MLSHAEVDALWDYSDPAASEVRFRVALNSNPESHNVLQTQIARTLGLRRQFDQARQVLDNVSAVDREADATLDARWNLEMGRTLNSSGDPAAARSYFEHALTRADEAGADFYSVDALHMLGIVAQGEESLDWNHKAIARAEASSDERTRNWLGSLLNNTGWSLHDLGRYEEALGLFEKAEAFRAKSGKEAPLRIARWCVARCLRSLGRYTEALTIQEKLAQGDSGGYVSEELGELKLVMGDLEEAKPHFAAAYAALSLDDWFVANEPGRLARLKELSGA